MKSEGRARNTRRKILESCDLIPFVILVLLRTCDRLARKGQRSLCGRFQTYQ